MNYTKEFSIDTFEFWSGARDTIEDIRKAGKMDELELLIKSTFECDDEPPTDTQINDMVWFDRDYIYEQLGLDENGNLIDDEDEGGLKF